MSQLNLNNIKYRLSPMISILPHKNNLYSKTYYHYLQKAISVGVLLINI